MDESTIVEIEDQGNVTVVGFKAASIVDPQAINAASDQIIEYVERNRPQMVLFDFDQVRFFSSQVLGVLVNVRAKLLEYGGEVMVSGIEPQLHRVFKITNLDTVFRFFSDRDSALSASNAG